MRGLISVLTWLACSQAFAAIYEYTDSRGNQVFTNQPPAEVQSRQINLPKPNTIAPAPVDEPQTEPNNSDAASPYQAIVLSHLPDEQALRANNGHFSVEVHTTPALDPKHRLQLLIDGQPHGPALYARVLEAVNVPRGEHQVAVQVLSGKRVLQTSDSQTIHVQRVNTQSPALRPKPRTAP